MKKLLVCVCLIYASLPVIAQKNIDGLWLGVLKVGVDLHMVFQITNDAKGYSAILDVPDQGAKGIQANMRRTKDSIFIEIEKIHGIYKGLIQNDSTIIGSWIQGREFPLNIKKVKEIMAPRRPQNPKPPYAYRSEDIIYYNSDSSIRYGATITIPNGKGPFPAVLLITGSGQQNRDEEILEHRPFAVIADHLTRNGYIVMRVDDRGMGQTTGDLIHATSRDFANDAEVSLEHLIKRREVNRQRVGLLGHSEGGMIAQMIAAERKDIYFLISLAGPGEKVLKLMTDQNEAVLSKNGMSKKYIDHYLQLYQKLIPVIINAGSEQAARSAALKEVNTWVKATDKNIVAATTGIKNEETTKEFINAFVPTMYSSWFRYFFAYDPDANLRKLNSKILALNGSEDIQVIAKTNLASMKSSLQNGRSKDFTMKELKGLNHLFQHCTTCTVQEYGQLEETIAPEVLETIASWLKTHVQ